MPDVETALAPRALGLGPPDKAVNECWFFHGTVPERLVQIISTGLNEHLASSGLFGAGAYFCDRIEKADQYVKADAGDAALEKLLYPDGHPGGEIFYVFVARATMGCTVRTVDALTDLDRGGATTAEAPRGRAATSIYGCRSFSAVTTPISTINFWCTWFWCTDFYVQFLANLVHLFNIEK